MEIRSLSVGEGLEGFALRDSRLGLELIGVSEKGPGAVIAPLDVVPHAKNSEASLEDWLRARLEGHRRGCRVAFANMPRLGALILAPSSHGEWLPASSRSLAAFISEHSWRIAPGFGCRRRDLQRLSLEGASVIGLSAAADHGHGETLRAYSMMSCLEALMAEILGRSDLHDARVAIVGVDDAGEVLAKRLAESGARLYLADQSSMKSRALSSRLGGVSIEVGDLTSLACQAMIFADPFLERSVFEHGPMRAKSLIGGHGEFLNDQTRLEIAEEGTPLIVPGWVGGSGSWIGLDQESSPSEDSRRGEDETLIRIRSIKAHIARWMVEAQSAGRSLYHHVSAFLGDTSKGQKIRF